ncbi:MAG TPA: DoxX family protein [Myxococcales bacterium]|nr:DoxX family protein [Myxococcales bacterium]
MSTDVAGAAAVSVSPRNRMLLAGRVLSGIAAVGLAASALAKITGQEVVVNNMVNQFGYPASAVMIVGVLELALTVVYAVPRTSFLGALLLTGYLGGAVATHYRVGDSLLTPFIPAVFMWAGLFLRDARLRELLPLRK